MILLAEDLWFPDVIEADEDGLVAVGGDLSTERLLLAYRSGCSRLRTFSKGSPSQKMGNEAIIDFLPPFLPWIFINYLLDCF